MKYEIAHGVPEHERVGHLDRVSCGSGDDPGEPDAIKWMN